jgi:hypothetical protein
MKNSLTFLFLLMAVLGGSAAWAGGNNETKLSVVVPNEISERASASLSGRATEFTPVLMLSGLEVGEAEGLSFEVRAGPSHGSSELGPVLAVTGLEGHRQEKPQEPLRKIDLPVPLNRQSLEFLAGKKEVTIVLKLKGSTSHPPLKVERAFLLTKESTT